MKDIHTEYEYKTFALCNFFPPGFKLPYDSRDVEFALNNLAQDGWEFVGDMTKNWHDAPPQVFHVFKRKLKGRK